MGDSCVYAIAGLRVRVDMSLPKSRVESSKLTSLLKPELLVGDSIAEFAIKTGPLLHDSVLETGGVGAVCVVIRYWVVDGAGVAGALAIC